MRKLVAGLMFVACSSAAIGQSVTTYGYDARGRLSAVRGGIRVKSDYNLDAADNRGGYHAAQQFPNAWGAPSLPHRIGYADGGGCATNDGASDFMTYGPYTTSIPAGSNVATWRLLVDNKAERAAFKCAPDDSKLVASNGREVMRLMRIAVLATCSFAYIAPAMAAETTTYTYDAKGRLVAVVHSGSVNNDLSVTYTHDNADNRTHVTTSGH